MLRSRSRGAATGVQLALPILPHLLEGRIRKGLPTRVESRIWAPDNTVSTTQARGPLVWSPNSARSYRGAESELWTVAKA